MKIIFLDKDGVLNSDRYFDKIQGLNIEEIENDIDINTIKLLKRAVEGTGAKVVLTASGRNTRRGEELKQLLASYSIAVDSTPFIQNERGREIKKYLEDHKEEIEDFVIIDDEIFDSYDNELMKKLIKISNGNGMSFGEGLQEKDVEEIIQRLGRKRQIDSDELEI